MTKMQKEVKNVEDCGSVKLLKHLANSLAVT